MIKWITTVLIVLLMFPLATAIIDCAGIMDRGDLPCLIINSWQFPNNCGSYTIKIYNEVPSLLRIATLDNYSDTSRCNITFGIQSNETELGSYLLNWSTGDSSKIIIEGEDEMASLAVTLFFGAITAVLFLVGLKVNFTKNLVANHIIKRCCILLGLFLLSLDTAMVATIADNTGLGLEREIFRYLWIINWTIYLFMVYLFWTTFTSTLDLWRQIGKQKRMGDENREGYS